MKSEKFTLIELLVIVAIIGILISVLLPSLQRAKELTKRSVCLSNLNQIGTSLFKYIVDSNGEMTNNNDWHNVIGHSGNGTIYPATSPIDRPLNIYIESNFKVAECPSDKGDAKKKNTCG
ncbi:MAG: type II secretion system GspH family protein [Lentisphaeraceae bacterium]|nr:type II secretion system GspH family protein [Lentisphaeraceae bacterium]